MNNVCSLYVKASSKCIGLALFNCAPLEWRRGGAKALISESSSQHSLFVRVLKLEEHSRKLNVCMQIKEGDMCSLDQTRTFAGLGCEFK